MLLTGCYGPRRRVWESVVDRERVLGRLERIPLTHLRAHSQVEIAPLDAAVGFGKLGVLVADQRIYGSILAFRLRPEMR